MNLTGGETYAALFNFQNNLLQPIDLTPSPTESPANEYLDSRLKIYVGGSKNRISTNNPAWASFSGYTYDPTFITNYFSSTIANVKRIMNNDYGKAGFLLNHLKTYKDSLFIFQFDDPASSSQVFGDLFNEGNTVTLGSSSAIEASDPTQGVIFVL